MNLFRCYLQITRVVRSQFGSIIN